MDKIPDNDSDPVELYSRSNFKIAGDSLFDFVSLVPESAHIKDPKTGAYIFSNQRNLEFYGLSQPSEIIGITIFDLDVFMRPYWGQGFVNEIGAVDYQVSNKRETISLQNKVFLDKTGLLHIQNMVKTPVLNYANQVAAILTLSFELTPNINPFQILSYYKISYPKKQDALHYFTKHLKIDVFFNESLTEQELRCLLYMRHNNGYKSVANTLSVSVKTIETHVSNIRAKSKKHVLSDVLEFLRDNL